MAVGLSSAQKLYFYFTMHYTQYFPVFNGPQYSLFKIVQYVQIELFATSLLSNARVSSLVSSDEKGDYAAVYHQGIKYISKVPKIKIDLKYLLSFCISLDMYN